MECYLLLAGASPRKQESLKWKKNLFAMMMVLRPVAQWNWISQTTIPDGFFFYRNRNAMNGNRIAIKIRIFQWGRQASSQTEAMRYAFTFWITWRLLNLCSVNYSDECEVFEKHEHCSFHNELHTLEDHTNIILEKRSFFALPYVWFKSVTVKNILIFKNCLISQGMGTYGVWYMINAEIKIWAMEALS